MRYALNIIGLLPIILFLWISQNYETAAFMQFDQNMSDYLFGNKVITMFHYIGDTVFVMIVTLILVLFFAIKQQDYRAVLFIVLTIAGGTGINQGLKYYFERPRPDIANQLDSFSFPSGHSMLGALYLLTIAYLLSKITVSTKASVAYWVGAIVLFVLIGMSRVAEGRHFATDVVGGWSLGIFWLTVCIIWYEARERRFLKKLQ